MKLLNTRTIAALMITTAMSVGNATAGDKELDASQSDEFSGTSVTDSFIDVRSAVASRFSRETSNAGGLSARQLAQKDFLNRSARFAGINL